MAPLPANPSDRIHNGFNGSPTIPAHHTRSKSASKTQRDKARVVFDKTIEGQYRHGKTGYRRVGALFITWADDDLNCEAAEVAKLQELFRTDFLFQTESFRIPTERFETALHKKLADFCYEYDSAEDLVIIYYGGHGYEGRETKEFKLAAKIENDGSGDPTAFFKHIQTCLQLPRCDQLLILDCCYAARAFAREHVGKRKFELLASAAHDVLSPAPHLPHSFTRNLHDTMKRLLETNPKGFSTSDLYREVYHTMPTSISNPTKPLLFNQARHSYGHIWLRPQVLTDRPPRTMIEGRYLKLTFRLNESPDLAVMNELALHLQFLPHVDQIRFEDLSAPKKQITDFMRLIVLASKLKPLVRRMQERRQGRKMIRELKDKDEKAPPSLIELHLAQDHHSVYDWSSASRDNGHSPKDTHNSHDLAKKGGTWPSASKAHSSNGEFSNGNALTEHQNAPFEISTSVTNMVPLRPSIEGLTSAEHVTGSENLIKAGPAFINGGNKRLRSASFDQKTSPSVKMRKIGE